MAMDCCKLDCEYGLFDISLGFCMTYGFSMDGLTPDAAPDKLPETLRDTTRGVLSVTYQINLLKAYHLEITLPKCT